MNVPNMSLSAFSQTEKEGDESHEISHQFIRAGSGWAAKSCPDELMANFITIIPFFHGLRECRQ